MDFPKEEPLVSYYQQAAGLVPVCSLTGPFSPNFSHCHSIEGWFSDYHRSRLSHNLSDDDHPFLVVQHDYTCLQIGQLCTASDFEFLVACQISYLYRHIEDWRKMAVLDQDLRKLLVDGVCILEGRPRSGLGKFFDLLEGGHCSRRPVLFSTREGSCRSMVTGFSHAISRLSIYVNVRVTVTSRC